MQRIFISINYLLIIKKKSNQILTKKVINQLKEIAKIANVSVDEIKKIGKSNDD